MQISAIALTGLEQAQTPVLIRSASRLASAPADTVDLSAEAVSPDRRPEFLRDELKVLGDRRQNSEAPLLISWANGPCGSCPYIPEHILRIVAQRKHRLDACAGFEWDRPHTRRIGIGIGVSQQEPRNVFFNEPLVVRGDVRHTKREKDTTP